MELLRKSREDAMVDAALRDETALSQDALDNGFDDIDPADFDFDAEDNTPLKEFATEDIISAYHSITTSWHKERLATSNRIPSLPSGTSPIQRLQSRTLLPLDIFRLPRSTTSGLRFFPNTTLQRWQLQIKTVARFDELNDTEADDVNDFNLDFGDGVLLPTLDTTESIPNLSDRRAQVGDNPSGTTLTTLVGEDIPLNRKQRLVVERVLSAALAWKDHPYDASKRNQMLLYVGGEGGTGKSQVIKAIVAGMDLIHRKSEVILMAPTGAAGYNIGGNTYHTSLGLSIAKKQKPTVSNRVRKLWSKKTIMIIDEISMMNLTSLGTINNQCKIARSLDRNSPDLFGGLPIVIFMGDFYQFPPIQGRALWREPKHGNDEDVNGQIIWHQFKKVIMLDEQMRQAEDAKFRELLGRARDAALTEEDLATLNRKVITSLFMPELEGATTVVKLNVLRHHINLVQMEHFARSRNQRIYVFPAQHNRVKSLSPLYLEDLLQQSDQGTLIPFQGLFFYTLGMPAVLLANICTLLGHVNGTRGDPSGIVVDPTSESFHD
jgi:hypothetical protein